MFSDDYFRESPVAEDKPLIVVDIWFVVNENSGVLFKIVYYYLLFKHYFK